MATLLATALLVAFLSGVSAWIATAVTALTWHAATGMLGGQDEFYRILRTYRLSALSRWTQMIRKRSVAASLLSLGETLGNPKGSSAADSLVIESDVTSDPTSLTSIH